MVTFLIIRCTTNIILTRLINSKILIAFMLTVSWTLCKNSNTQYTLYISDKEKHCTLLTVIGDIILLSLFQIKLSKYLLSNSSLPWLQCSYKSFCLWVQDLVGNKIQINLSHYSSHTEMNLKKQDIFKF